MVRSTRSEAESLPLTGSHARLCFDSFGGKTGGVRVVAALFSFRVEGSLGCSVTLDRTTERRSVTRVVGGQGMFMWTSYGAL